MGIKLVVEVLDHSPETLTLRDRLLLIVIAEKANDTTREGWPGWRLIAKRMGWTSHKDGGKNAVSTALAELAKHGVEVRVPIGKDKSGRLYFAAHGHQSTYRLPRLPWVAETATHEGLHEQPPIEREGWQSRASKGGNPQGRRVAETATPSPQGTLKEPSSAPLAVTPGAEGNPMVTEAIQSTTGATLAEATAILKLIRDEKTGIRNLGAFVDHLARNGELPGYLARVREDHDRSSRAEQRRRAERGPECEHRVPGGDDPDFPLCAICKRRRNA